MSILQVENLSKSYKAKKAVNNVSFSVDPGEIVGFIGPNGAGKTTSLRCILDIIRRDSGNIKINGHSMPKDRVKALSHTACWMDISHLYYDLTAEDHIEFTRKIRNVSKEAVKKYGDLFDIKGFMKLKVHKYSYGMRQRLGLALAVMTEPELLILDEPTNGLDPVGVQIFREALLMLAQEKNTAIFFSSHALSELEKVVDRALFIRKGELVHTEINKGEHVYKIKVLDAEKAQRLLAPLEISTKGDGDYISFVGAKAVNTVLSILYENNVEVLDIEKRETDLEEIFYSLYEKGIE